MEERAHPRPRPDHRHRHWPRLASVLRGLRHPVTAQFSVLVSHMLLGAALRLNGLVPGPGVWLVPVCCDVCGLDLQQAATRASTRLLGTGPHVSGCVSVTASFPWRGAEEHTLLYKPQRDVQHQSIHSRLKLSFHLQCALTYKVPVLQMPAVQSGMCLYYPQCLIKKNGIVKNPVGKLLI